MEGVQTQKTRAGSPIKNQIPSVFLVTNLVAILGFCLFFLSCQQGIDTAPRTRFYSEIVKDNFDI
jgi:HAMP domain-containing protein